MKRKVRRTILTWHDERREKPKEDEKVLCALRVEFTNAPWRWDYYFACYFKATNAWSRTRPDKWARIPSLPLPPRERQTS